MSYYKETLQEELERNIESQHVFKKRFDSLKKGSLCKKVIKGKEYFYLKYRKDGKVVTEYIGPVSSVDNAVLEKELKKSKYCAETIKELKKTEKKLRKAIKVL